MNIDHEFGHKDLGTFLLILLCGALAVVPSLMIYVTMAECTKPHHCLVDIIQLLIFIFVHAARLVKVQLKVVAMCYS